MKRALISVSDKRNVTWFARGLIACGYEIISTGGTKQLLDREGITTIGIEDVTGFPEMLDGRVKTLHPVIHGGLLALRDKPSHVEAITKAGIKYIDLVCVNLYPFSETIAKPNISFDDAIEQIDIGGPSMLRSAAKNYRYVTAVCDINDYEAIIKEIKENQDTSLETKKRLSAKVFAHTAHYDSIIANYLSTEDICGKKTIAGKQFLEMRYGENPHQQAALYQTNNNQYSVFAAEILNGKPLSFNNVQDANAALNILKEFDEPTCVALKHMNPCGVGTGDNLLIAYQKAYASDPVSIFGGIIALNREVDINLANELSKIFLEIIIAPKYTDDALNILKKKKNLRILKLDTSLPNTDTYQFVSVNGGFLYQEIDKKIVNLEALVTVTKLEPSKAEIDDLMFAWKVVKHVKSNAIVIASEGMTCGVGAGQMNRVGAAKIALEWAKAHFPNKNFVLASDAFFPFNDVVHLASQYNVSAIIQPGGSIADEESIKACDELGIKMVFTGMRHFKH